MELHFTPEQEAHLQQMAQHEGKTPEELIVDVVQRRTDEDSVFRMAVQRGLDQANAEDFVEEDEMEARVQKMMHRSMRVIWTPEAADHLESIHDYLFVTAPIANLVHHPHHL